MAMWNYQKLRTRQTDLNINATGQAKHSAKTRPDFQSDLSGVHGMQMTAFFNADTDLDRGP